MPEAGNVSRAQRIQKRTGGNDLAAVSLDSVERVENIRGPASLQYGSRSCGRCY
ncbi:MAG: TonB-dependent receptor plug domain-containing protein [Deltaproteobacteria bacterium]|nr:TonB-dependent receptor plug domain-containing protein [Deltaproteobacteria bacterium]